MEFEAKATHAGQYRPYGDSFYEWDIKTECTDENEVVSFCFEKFRDGQRVPESAEYHRNIRHGSGHDGGADYYFAGYYELKKIDGGYRFTICSPWTD